jgi:hypothetical protein
MNLDPPLHPQRAHVDQTDPRCDTLYVLLLALWHRCCADMNAVAGANSDWNLHWPDGPDMNHFTHIIDARTGKLRPMTAVELHRPVDQWPDDAEIHRWRKRVGRRWVRPFTVRARQAQARRLHVYVTWELKSRTYREPAIAARFVAATRAAGGRWCVMTLVVMAFWAEKLTAFHNAGAGTALLAHGAVRPTDLHLYSPAVIDRIWGNFR